MTDYKKALEGRTIKEVKDCTSRAFEVVLDNDMRLLIDLGCSGGCCYGSSHLKYALLKSNELIERKR